MHDKTSSLLRERARSSEQFPLFVGLDRQAIRRIGCLEYDSNLTLVEQSQNSDFPDGGYFQSLQFDNRSFQLQTARCSIAAQDAASMRSLVFCAICV